MKTAIIAQKLFIIWADANNGLKFTTRNLSFTIYNLPFTMSFFEKHKDSLEKAIQATKERTFYAHHPEHPGAYY